MGRFVQAEAFPVPRNDLARASAHFVRRPLPALGVTVESRNLGQRRPQPPPCRYSRSRRGRCSS
jgi:hypothetical protein